MSSFFICTQLTEYMSTRCWKEFDNWYKIFLGLPCSSSSNCKIRESTKLCHNQKWFSSDNLWRKGTIWMSKAPQFFCKFLSSYVEIWTTNMTGMACLFQENLVWFSALVKFRVVAEFILYILSTTYKCTNNGCVVPFNMHLLATYTRF